MRIQDRILENVTVLRNKIVYGIFKILFRKDCKLEKE